MPARSDGPRSRSLARAAGLLSIWLLLLIFIVYPLAMLLLRAFFADGQFTLDALIAAVKSTRNLRALRNSLILAFLVGPAGCAGRTFFSLSPRAGQCLPPAAWRDAR